MEQGSAPQRISPGLQWKIEEIPGENGWLTQDGHAVFEQTALLLVQSGIPEKTIVALLHRMYWGVANSYGG